MEMLEQIVAIVGKIFKEHWSFIAVAILLGAIGEVIKGIVLGKNNTKTHSSKFHFWFKETIAMHPIAAGAALGLVLGSLVPESIDSGNLIGSVLYFAVSGTLSTSIYDAVKIISPTAVKFLRNKVADASSSAKDK
jgi:hypothetical protein